MISNPISGFESFLPFCEKTVNRKIEKQKITNTKYFSIKGCILIEQGNIFYDTLKEYLLFNQHEGCLHLRYLLR